MFWRRRDSVGFRHAQLVAVVVAIFIQSLRRIPPTPMLFDPLFVLICSSMLRFRSKGGGGANGTRH